ncbi:hypothetical protein COO60DRAFT_219853 [Scenedesmus sp. NREL 46B-D3]|nr:hypothetical protein COO60DRAFT_219853 [Scenedesmus sp. NREL 46B-D3]
MPHASQGLQQLQHHRGTTMCTKHSRSSQQQQGQQQPYSRGMPAPVQLLQLLLQQALGAIGEAGSSGGCDAAAAGLQQYVVELLQHLQEAATVHEVLAVCLFQAAAACAALVGADVAGRWMCQLLHSLLRHPGTQQSAVQQQAAAVAAECWQGLALQHSSWRCIMSCMLDCVPDVRGLLQQLQGCIAQATATAQGLDRLCGVLMALRGCGSSCTEAVHQMLSAALAAALSQACQEGLLPPLLLLQRLLRGSPDYSNVLADAAAQALAPDSANSVAAWCCFLDTASLMLHLTLPAADQALLQALMQLLQQLKPSAAPAVQQRISSTLDTLQDAAHALKQQQQQQAGTDSSIPPLNASIRSSLEQFRQQGPVNGRRRFKDMQARSWAIQRGHLPKLCDAISLNAPSNAADARLRWEFLMVGNWCQRA